MQLSEFTWTSVGIEPKEVFQAIENSYSCRNEKTQAIESTQSQEERNRRLPTQFGRWAGNCHEASGREIPLVDVLKNLADGWSNQWICLGQRWRTPSKSSSTRSAERELGHG